MVIFSKAWRGYCPGERAGFSPEAEALLVSRGIVRLVPGSSGSEAPGLGAPIAGDVTAGGEVDLGDLLTSVGDRSGGVGEGSWVNPDGAPPIVKVGEVVEPDGAARPDEVLGRRGMEPSGDQAGGATNDDGDEPLLGIKGVGPATVEHLQGRGITTRRQLREADLDALGLSASVLPAIVRWKAGANA